MNKKGSILDFPIIIAIILITGVSIFATFIVINTTSNIAVFQENTDANAAVQHSRNAVLSADNLLIFVIVGLSLFSIISAAMVFNHPAFFIISFVLLCIFVGISASVSNAYYEFRTSTYIESTANQFPKIVFLMDKLPFYIAFMGVAILIAGMVSYTRQ